jgi:hypothetical protein
MNSPRFDWPIIDGEHVSLVFDKIAFSAHQAFAVARGIETTELISDTLARFFGDVLVARSESATYNRMVSHQTRRSFPYCPISVGVVAHFIAESNLQYRSQE